MRRLTCRLLVLALALPLFACSSTPTNSEPESDARLQCTRACARAETYCQGQCFGRTGMACGDACRSRFTSCLADCPSR